MILAFDNSGLRRVRVLANRPKPTGWCVLFYLDDFRP